MARKFIFKDTSWMSDDELAVKVIERLNRARMNPVNYLYRGFPCEEKELELIIKSGTDRRTLTEKDRKDLIATTENYIPEFGDKLKIETEFGTIRNSPQGTVIEGEGLVLPRRITKREELKEYAEKDTVFLFRKDRLADSIKHSRGLSPTQNRAIIFAYSANEVTPIGCVLNHQYKFKNSPQKALKACFIEEHE